MKQKHKTFFDEETRLDKLEKQGDPLLKLASVVNWKIFSAILRNALKSEQKGPGGRPPFDYIMMFKILVLQSYYNLSDDQMEFQINDRLSFMRFLGIGLQDTVPDAKTIWHFREVLTKKGKIKSLFNKFNKELSAKNLTGNKGVIVDASFVHVPEQHNTKDENESIKSGIVPDDWSVAKKRQKDTDARWTKKNDESHFGYKNHVKCDAKTKLIEDYCTTPANVHDSQGFMSMFSKDDWFRKFYADSAYKSTKIEEFIADNFMKSRVIEKGYRNKHLTKTKKKWNRMQSKTRCRIEHIFGFMHNSMNGMYIKTIGAARAQAKIGMMNLTYNIFRYMQVA